MLFVAGHPKMASICGRWAESIGAESALRGTMERHALKRQRRLMMSNRPMIYKVLEQAAKGAVLAIIVIAIWMLVR